MNHEYPPQAATAPEDRTRREQLASLTQRIRERLLSHSNLYVDSLEKELPPEEPDLDFDGPMELTEPHERFYVPEDPELIIDEAEEFRENQLRQSVFTLGKLTASLGLAKFISTYVDFGAVAPHVDQRAVETMMNVPTLGGAAVAAILMVMKFREADRVYGSTDRSDPQAVAALLRKI